MSLGCVRMCAICSARLRFQYERPLLLVVVVVVFDIYLLLLLFPLLTTHFLNRIYYPVRVCVCVCMESRCH